MEESRELSYRNDETTNADLERQDESADCRHNATGSVAHSFKRGWKQRATLLVAGLCVLAVIAGVFAWRHQTGPAGDPSSAAHVAPPADVIVASESQMRQIAVEPVGEENVIADRDTTGKVSFNEDHYTPVLTPYAGRVVAMMANKGDNVRRGQPLLVVESPDLVATQNDLATARSDVDKARIALDAARVAAARASRLYEREAIAAKDLQQAEADLARAQGEQQRAQASLAVAESRLALFGKRPDEFTNLGREIDRRITIPAPISGTIVDRKVGPGEYIKPDRPDPLFLISDLSVVWVLADVFESDLARIHLDAPVEIGVNAYPGRVFPARISYISPTVDPATRTVRVRCLVPNAGGLLKPDMFARVRIRSGAQQSVAVVPASAIVSQGDKSLALVEESPRNFRKRQVEIGSETDGRVAVKDGLKPGEHIVTRGALLLCEFSQAGN